MMMILMPVVELGGGGMNVSRVRKRRRGGAGGGADADADAGGWVGRRRDECVEGKEGKERKKGGRELSEGGAQRPVCSVCPVCGGMIVSREEKERKSDRKFGGGKLGRGKLSGGYVRGA